MRIDTTDQEVEWITSRVSEPANVLFLSSEGVTAGHGFLCERILHFYEPDLDPVLAIKLASNEGTWIDNARSENRMNIRNVDLSRVRSPNDVLRAITQSLNEYVQTVSTGTVPVIYMDHLADQFYQSSTELFVQMLSSITTTVQKLGAIGFYRWPGFTSSSELPEDVRQLFDYTVIFDIELTGGRIEEL